ncbi:uncharacterized protein [Montipora foliosa]|uniref:uncharacterized protein n=1 Tax=Montipora foliosa TaxID=591990 RepID=UPI0035F1E7B8
MNFTNLKDLNFQNNCMQNYGSIENLKCKAKDGDVDAQVDLGSAYSEGFGDELPKDIDKAIGWLSCAVEKGYDPPFVLGKLGEVLDQKGTPQHRRKAYEMYQRAARFGYTSSQINLAEMYRCGVEGVVDEDMEEAFQWYKKAAGEDLSDVYNSDLGPFERLLEGTLKKVENTLGDSQKKMALRCLYKYYLEGDCPEGKPQPTKAVYYLTRAAELGDTEAQLELGQVYLNGSCEQLKDLAKAKRWLEKAASKGNISAKRLLKQCIQMDATQHSSSDVGQEAFTQSLGIMEEKLKQRIDRHPFAILQPVAFSEEMLSEFKWSPTARIYLKAFKLVKEGFKVLCESNFTAERGISLIAHGYLTENSILQAFPQCSLLKDKVLGFSEQILKTNSSFFEALVISLAFKGFESRKESIESEKSDQKRIMCLKNIIHFIQNAEPSSPPLKHPFTFDENYSSWLHILYDYLGAIYSVKETFLEAAEAFENSLKCCTSYFPAKRGLAYCLLMLYSSKGETDNPDTSTQHLLEKQKLHVVTRKIHKYTSWTKDQLRDSAEKTMKEFLAQAPSCWKTYPNVCYYLAQLAILSANMTEFKRNYELGQDAEEKRLPFFDPVDLPLKDLMTPFYQLFANVQTVKCGNRTCTKDVKENELKNCGACRSKQYCSKECQIADWKNHKATCHVSKGRKGKERKYADKTI